MKFLLFSSVAAGLLGCSQSRAADRAPAVPAGALPPPAQRKVVFTDDVRPILEKKCANCHGYGRDKGAFRIDSRASLLQGGETGASAVPGKSAESLLIKLVAGLDPDNIMPRKGSRLTAEQVGLLRAWIDQGLEWDASVSFAQKPPANLKPRKPELGEAATDSGNPVDALLKPYYAARGIKLAAPVEDRVFARRVWLDTIGLLPPPEELEAFLADSAPDKRTTLVRSLLGRNEAYAGHWLTFWNDLLRNDYRGTGYIDGGRKQITSWLYRALLTNMPYDRFVRELIDPGPESEGFVKGIVWRGVVNSSQTPEMQAAQNISQVFMGVNLKCASCHDSFVNQWRLSDAYGLAAVYSEAPLEMFECDKPTGRTMEARFIYPELGDLDPQADKEARRRRLAEIVTSPADGRLSRTIVNRLWGRFMGRALVEPVDDMEQAAWHPPLLDWLAEDLVAQGYDLKKTIERILTSDAYRLPTVPRGESAPKEYVFRGPDVRRLTAEQFRDGVSQVVGVWHASAEFKPESTNRVRTGFVAADALTTALGRPNRDQVVTVRPSESTTLQALELMNGRTLARVLEEGAVKLAGEEPSPANLAALIYRRSLGRPPSAAEQSAAAELLGSPLTREGVADLLWATVMLPEFQLVY